jgi:hypothetical protein
VTSNPAFGLFLDFDGALVGDLFPLADRRLGHTKELGKIDVFAANGVSCCGQSWIFHAPNVSFAKGAVKQNFSGAL